MSRVANKITAFLLCLATTWSGQSAVFGQSAGAGANNDGPANKGLAGGVKFSTARPQLDSTPAYRLKPFTLGAAANAVRTGAQDDALKAGADANPGDPLKADTNYQLDPFNKHLSGAVDQNRFKLQASEVGRLLSQYNVELLVDRSQSMGKRDCPDGLSRWQWCGVQAASLAQVISPLVPQGLTIVPFATEYDVFSNASPKNIEMLFQSMRLQTGTRLYEPMAEEFDSYFANRAPGKKPLLVVVVTDGLPVPKRIEPELVRRELVAASNRSRDCHEVTVIFCQIGGDDDEGQAYLQDLDQNLGSYGARYNIVHTIPFNTLMANGLGPSLAASLQRYAPPPPRETPIPSARQLVKGHAIGFARPSRLARRSGE